jgi:predicted HicB family RNase H-like nuclease
MELQRYVEEVGRQLAVAAEAGGEEARQLAERLAGSLDSIVRLTLLEALGEAAAEITRDLVPGSVDVRLRGREPEFVVNVAQHGATDEPSEPASYGDDAAMTRINLRLPDQLKAKIEAAAEREGVSTNACLGRGASAAVERREPGAGRVSGGGQNVRGWVR